MSVVATSIVLQWYYHQSSSTGTAAWNATVKATRQIQPVVLYMIVVVWIYSVAEEFTNKVE